MRFLIIFLFLLTNSFASEVPDIKNLIINKEYKKFKKSEKKYLRKKVLLKEKLEFLILKIKE